MKMERGCGRLNERGSIGQDNRRPTQELVGIVEWYLKWVQEELARVEALIDFGATILRYSQPPIEGKVDVRWWLVDGSMRVRRPVFVRWMRARTGRAAGRVAVPKRVSHLKGVFIGLNNGPIADAVVHELRGLMRYWETLVGMVRALNLAAGRRMGGIKSMNRDLEYTRDRLMVLRDELVVRLQRQGVLVPDEFERSLPTYRGCSVADGDGNGGGNAEVRDAART